MKQALRLIVDGPGPGSWNMAVDEALATIEGAPPRITLRLYDWSRPTISLGRNQPASDFDLERLGASGTDLVRRPTGGKAILHHRELTFALAGPGGSWGDLGLGRLVGILSQGVARALRRWDLSAEVGRSPGGLAPGGPGLGAACFAAGGRDEVWVGGGKLAGLAGRRWRRAYLVHGSLLIRPTHLDLLDYMDCSGRDREDWRSALRRGTTDLESLMEVVPSWHELAGELASAVGALLEREVREGELTAAEEEWARHLHSRKHEARSWILTGRGE